MSAQPEMSQDAIDEALECRIECARLAMTLVPDEASKRDHLERMEQLIGQRSPQQIARMSERLPKPWGTK